MRRRLAILAILAVPAAFAADWNPKLAAEYMDSRQKAWFAWPNANKGENGVCLSCHTGLPYLLARPELRKHLHESIPTQYESELLDAVRLRLSKKTPQEYEAARKEPAASQQLGVEAVLSALLFASTEAAGSISKDTERAFDRLWSLQIKTGDSAGAWNWDVLELDPFEEPDSVFYGASLAALATGIAPPDYQPRPNIDALQHYLKANREHQPLHNRLMLAWASTKLKGTLTPAQRKAITDEALQAQQPDGGWTIESLGAWVKHPNAPPDSGSNAYATGLVTFVLQKTGIPATNPAVAHALDWLRSHQDSESGFWDAQSMNKRYEPGSMQSQFMREAATGYAVLALLESEKSR